LPAQTTKRPVATKLPQPEPKPEPAEPGSLSGNICADPELRFTPTGRAVADIRVACSDRVQDTDGTWVDTDTEYFTVVAWGSLAEHCVATLKKGDRFCAVGLWRDRTWTDNDNNEHSVTELTARDAGPSLLWNDAVIKRVQRTSRAS
jgi:single-strand DNA-binding protein